MSTQISFRVYGTEFCRILSAVALFQGSPREFDSYGAVRCLATGDGLAMAATNGASAAIGMVQMDDVTGRGPFSLPHAQVKAILAVFKRKLPKGTNSWDYVLEVTVADQWIKIEDVSVLFDRDTFTIAVPHPETAERGDPSESEKVMSTLSVVAGGLDPEQEPITLSQGIFFSANEMALIARAAKGLGLEVNLRLNGRRLVAALAEDFTVYTAGTLRSWDGATPPFIDERALQSWRGWLTDVVDNGVI